MPVTLDTTIADSAVANDAEVLGVDAALAKLVALDERLRQIVQLKYFGDMSNEETAEVMEISLRTVQRDWAKARLFLSASLKSVKARPWRGMTDRPILPPFILAKPIILT